MIELKQESRGVVLPVSAQAGARRNGIVGVRNGMLRVAVTAAAEKGKANRAIIGVLSEALDVPKSAIEIVSGEASSKKRFVIVDGNTEAIHETLRELLQGIGPTG
jgi:uncharacterized protein (TIGR00251 family)